MSALPQIADMCGATRDVRFGPIADMKQILWPPRPRVTINNRQFCDARHIALGEVSLLIRANRPLREASMTGIEIVALASLALCFTALQFAWLLNQCGYSGIAHPH